MTTIAAGSPVGGQRRRECRRVVFAACVCLALAIVHTWPVATDPAHLFRDDNADAQLNAWIVSWVAHQVVTDPLRLFEANIFHPEPAVLALSEPMVVPGLLGAPVRWLGGSPILTYNVLWVFGLASTALAMYILVFALTRSHWGGLLAGLLAAFNVETMTRVPQLQAQCVASLPLCLWALHRLVRRPGWSQAAWLAGAALLVTWTSVYLTVFTFFAAAAILMGTLPWWWTRRGPVLRYLTLATLLAALGSAPVLTPYWRLHQAGVRRSLDSAARSSATATTYLSTTSRLHYDWWSSQFYQSGRGRQFPGVLALGLAGVGLTAVRRRRQRQGVALLVSLGVAGVVLSLGPSTPVYGWFYEWFPPIQAIRAPTRFAFLWLLAVAGLAGVGLAVLQDRLAGRNWVWLAVGGALVAGTQIENLHAPHQLTYVTGFSPVYKALTWEGQPDGAVVELPAYGLGRFFRNGAYVLASTQHWRPLVNGYSGFTPVTYRDAARRLRRFPDQRSLDTLRELGVSHVVFHADRYSQEDADEILDAVRLLPDLALVVDDPMTGTRLYRLFAPLLGDGDRRMLPTRIENREGDPVHRRVAELRVDRE